MLLRLRPLALTDERDARDAHRELSQEGFPFLLDWDPEQPWSSYLERLGRLRRGVDLPTDRVPATFLIAEHSGALVGRVSIRHQLNDFLANEGGHIGYGVRPQYRRRGFASEILRQSLILARAQGIDPVLVTCDQTNTASATIIERGGGRLEDVRPGTDGIAKRRYWIS